jgi:hypothetical protein
VRRFTCIFAARGRIRIHSEEVEMPTAQIPNGKTINNVDATPTSPAACVFQNQLFLFWKANDASNRIYFSVSPDGKNWSNGATINSTDSTPNALAACVFQNQLFLFWKANDASNRIYFSASSDGKKWPNGATINSMDTTSDALAACTFQTSTNHSSPQLYLFWNAGGFRREVQPRRQHWFLNEKVGFPRPHPRLLLGFQGTKSARREGISSPFNDAGGCTSPQNSGPPLTESSSVHRPMA